MPGCSIFTNALICPFTPLRYVMLQRNTQRYLYIPAAPSPLLLCTPCSVLQETRIIAHLFFPLSCVCMSVLFMPQNATLRITSYSPLRHALRFHLLVVLCCKELLVSHLYYFVILLSTLYNASKYQRNIISSLNFSYYAFIVIQSFKNRLNIICLFFFIIIFLLLTFPRYRKLQ